MAHRKPLKQAIDAAGGKSKLARLLKITPQAVDQWNEIPVAQVLKIEKALGIRREDQRPDFYPRETAE